MRSREQAKAKSTDANYNIGVFALSTTQQELVDNLPRPKRPRFLDLLVEHLNRQGMDLEHLQADERPLLAHYEYEYIIDQISAADDRRLADGAEPLKLSPIHLMVPTNLNRFYLMYSSSLTGKEGVAMRDKRLAEVRYSATTARTHLSQGYVDLSMVEGLERMMNDHYPGFAAIATEELLAAYGSGRDRIALMPVYSHREPQTNYDAL